MLDIKKEYPPTMPREYPPAGMLNDTLRRMGICVMMGEPLLEEVTVGVS